MKLVAVRWRQQAKQDAATYPRLILEQGGPWTDLAPTDTTGYETLFDVYIDRGPGERKLLGSTKILERGQPSVRLRGEMDALPDECCSLGQTIDYYEALEQLGEPVCGEILRALRDVTADETVARAFEHEPGFRASLLRFSEASRIYHYRPRRLHREPPPREPLRIEFRALLPGFEDPHAVEFDFHPEPGSVGRLAALVGKSGTGKTSLLARLAAALWGLHRHNREQLIVRGPPVGRVIAVSYSALDAFERPPHHLAGQDDQRARPVLDNYRYCGFRAEDGSLRPELLFGGLGEDLTELRKLGRLEMWTRMLEETRLGDGDPALKIALEAGRMDDLVSAVRVLGAGHKTALSVLTRLLASLRNGSLVLFDEPELNLHPSLLASLLRVLHDWLEQFDGYGIVATHSPIVLQEIPGRNVRVLDRVGRIPVVRHYEAESFGQSLSEIVGEVFGLDERDKNYATALRGLLDRGMTPEQIESAFGRPLSLNVRMALRALGRRGGENA